MGAKLYIHIGLPKTATSTLQKEVFPLVDDTLGFTYAGTMQPRGKNGELYSAFMGGVYSGEFDEFHDLMSRLKGEASVIVSEEMITVDSENGTWKGNLRNLKQMVSSYDYRILLSVREPLDAMFSYYVERYEEFRRGYPVFDVRVLENSHMLIYKYNTFIKTLEDFFSLECLYFINFDEIINGRFGGLERFLGCAIPIVGPPDDFNNKARTGEVVYAQGRDFHRRFVNFAKKRLRMDMSSPYLRPLRSSVRACLSRIQPKYAVPLLSDEAKEEFREFLRDDVKMYERLCADERE